MYVLLILLLVVNVRPQQDPCSCSCCVGQSCIHTPLPTIYVSSCTLTTCLAQCRATYPQCQGNYPNGQISVECRSTMTTIASQSICRCDCCNTGSALCVPSYIGQSFAYLCQPGSCSIACAQQYPSQCVSNQNGVTQGTCIGPVSTTTTSASTTVGPYLGNTCSCNCCQTGFYCSPIYVGTTSAFSCTSDSCTQACRTRYPSLCPALLNIGQASGTCKSGNTRCTIDVMVQIFVLIMILIPVTVVQHAI